MTPEQQNIYDKIENINSAIFNIAEVYYHISDLAIFLVQCNELKQMSLKSGVSFKEVKELNKSSNRGYFNYPSLQLFCEHSIKSKGNTVSGAEVEEKFINICEQVLLTVIEYASEEDKKDTLLSMRQYKNSLAKRYEKLIEAKFIEEEKALIESSCAAVKETKASSISAKI